MKNTKHIPKYLLLSFAAFFCIIPFAWVLLSSVKSSNEIYISAFGWPREFLWENYGDAWRGAQIAVSFANSLFYSFSSVLLLVLLSSMAAYALARIWKNRAAYQFFTLGIMIPMHAVIIPLLMIFRRLQLVNTRTGIILAYTVAELSFSIFILTAFMKTIPSEMEEAATIDGSGRFRTFFQIILPMAKPGLATIGTFAFINSWNDLLLALVMIAGPQLKTINLACYNLRGQYIQNYGLITAGLVMMIVPVVVIYILFQEQVVKGITAGAVKS